MTSTLVLGGARSGKSAYAESLLRSPALYVATAEARDAEMIERIARHRDRRGEGWRTVEAPLDIAGAVAAVGGDTAGILVDCLTLWISNVLEAGLNVADETARLCGWLQASRLPVVLVSSEVGLGLVPETALGRAFRDWQGIVNQRVAAVCPRVVFVAAGLPLVLKDQT